MLLIGLQISMLQDELSRLTLTELNKREERQDVERVCTLLNKRDLTAFPCATNANCPIRPALTSCFWRMNLYATHPPLLFRNGIVIHNRATPIAFCVLVPPCSPE